jgi:shikimate kinase
MPRHLLLIGLPGAGKSTVGRLLAERLGSHCTDIDPILERATGMTVAELFAEEGEPWFREREHRAVLESLGLPPHVVAPGGGWAAQPGQLEAAMAAGRPMPIHLAVDPAVAAARLAGGAGGTARPLLAGDPAARLTELAARRRLFYQRATVEVEVSDRTPEEVADLLMAIAKSKAGW